MKRQIFYYYRKYILKIAYQKYPPIRKRKFSLEYYLDKFIFMLNDYVKWSSLQINYNHVTYHWSKNSILNF